MAIAKLVIYPEDLEYLPENETVLADALTRIDFIGEALPDKHNHPRFLIGEQFLNYVTFLGCSPAIEIEPPADGSEDFCHIVFELHPERVVFHADAAGKGPRCPHCRYEEKNWQAIVAQATDILHTQYTCPECQQVTPLLELNWRKAAVAAKTFICIYSVFPNEAVLADKVLSSLQDATGSRWRYFYSR